ncbi:hypothetical protein ABIC47_001795 [Leifsonia sp. 563]|uniref:DUF4190 domain-containing protein n=1 Tax=Leifsonia sp. 563 TaxID=3156412 RepID=UPI003399181C
MSTVDQHRQHVQQPPRPVHPPYPPYTYGAAPAGTNVLAVVSLVTAFVFPIAAVICGHIAFGQIKRTGENGGGLALAGVIVGYCFLALGLLFGLLYAVVIAIGIAASVADPSLAT